MKVLKFLSMALVITLSACGGGDDPEPNNPNSEKPDNPSPGKPDNPNNPDKPDVKNDQDSTAIQVNGEIADLTDGSSNKSWNSSDAIGVTVTSTTSGLTKGINVKYYRKDNMFISETPIFIKDLKNAVNKEVATFSAYYPFQGTTVTDAGIISNITTDDQSKQSTFDFMFASGARGNLSTPTINFTGTASFQHRMSQLTLVFKEGSNVSFPGNLTSYKVKGLIMEGTFDTKTGEAKANSKAKAKDLSVPLTITTENLKNGQYTSSPIILYPQDVESGKFIVEITLNGQTFTTTIALPDSQNKQLQAGYNLNYTITLSQDKVTMGRPTIQKWNDGGEIDGIARPE